MKKKLEYKTDPETLDFILEDNCFFGEIPKINHCPNCGFNFKKIKPRLDLYNCECGKSQADVSNNYIRIISIS